MAVDKGVVDADICKATAEKKCVDLQPAKQNLQISPEECRISALWHEIVVIPKTHLLLRNIRSWITRETMDALVPIKLPAEVNPIGPVDLLNKYDRNADLMGRVDDLSGGKHSVFVAGHVVDRSHFAIVDERTLLDVDYDESGPALDELS